MNALKEISSTWADEKACVKSKELVALINADFIATLLTYNSLMKSIKHLAQCLQAQEIEMHEAFKNIEEVLQIFRNFKRTPDEKCRLIAQSLRVICGKLDINYRLQGPRTSTLIDIIKEKFFVATVSKFIENLESKISNRPDLLIALGNLKSNKTNEKELELLAESYKEIISTEHTAHEIKKTLESEIKLCNGPLKLENVKNLPFLKSLVLIRKTVIISNAQAERQFSKLKIIKSELRNTTSQERLDSLTNLSSNSDITHKIDLDAVVDEFDTKNRRILL